MAQITTFERTDSDDIDISITKLVVLSWCNRICWKYRYPSRRWSKYWDLCCSSINIKLSMNPCYPASTHQVQNILIAAPSAWHVVTLHAWSVIHNSMFRGVMCRITCFHSGFQCSIFLVPRDSQCSKRALGTCGLGVSASILCVLAIADLQILHPVTVMLIDVANIQH
jgi:hypothetical protein